MSHPTPLQAALDGVPKERAGRVLAAEVGFVQGRRRRPHRHPRVDLGGLSTQRDELLVTAALIGPHERTVLAEDLERVGLARQARRARARACASRSPAARSPSSTAHAATPTCATQLRRRLSESRRELLLTVPRNLRPREIACLVADVQEEEIGPELERTILRGLRAGEQIVRQVRSHGEHVGAPQAVERVLQHARPDSRIADVARERDRLRGERLPPGAVVLVEQLLRLQRQQLGAPARVGAVVELDRAFDRVDPLVVEVADEAREASGVGERRGSGQIGITERRRDLCCVQTASCGTPGSPVSCCASPRPINARQRSASSTGPSRSSASANSFAASAGARLSSARRPARVE